MPLFMKIQPIDVRSDDHLRSEMVAKPAVKSRLKRLFRISVAAAEREEPNSGDHFEPSSVCLAKMVQNFMEETNEKAPTVAGRNPCNCFNGSGSDGSDGESDAGISDFLKSLVVGGSVNERKVLAETTEIIGRENNKVCKKKDEVRKIVSEGLNYLGYDAAICKSKWDKSLSFPAEQQGNTSMWM